MTSCSARGALLADPLKEGPFASRCGVLKHHADFGKPS